MPKAKSKSYVKALERIEDEFLAGNFSKLSVEVCPVCGSLRSLSFSVVKDMAPSFSSMDEIKGAINIYCVGQCNRLLTHLNGLLPKWTESIDDWEEFSASLYE